MRVDWTGCAWTNASSSSQPKHDVENFCSPLSNFFGIHLRMTKLKDKWVLITGASSGFGAAAAVAFGREGSKLLLGARGADRLEKGSPPALNAGAGAAHFPPPNVT